MSKHLESQDTLLLMHTVLDAFFARSIQEAAHMDPSYERLWHNLHVLIQSGGKRLRPKLTFLSYVAFGGREPELIAPVAAAQELLHFSLLIHDDIIDRDYVRHGVANIAGRYKVAYAPFVSSEKELTHYANSAALLAGDLMLSGAHQLITTSELSDDDKTTAQHLLSAGIFEVAGGELLDTELSFSTYKDGDALKVAIHKTASYSFILPLVTGARLAGANKKQCDSLRKYALALGVAYQLTDDLLGIFGDETQTGKSTIGDIIEGKRTFLVEKALEAFSSSDHAMFMQVFGNPHATPLEIETAKRLIESSAARRKTEEKIDEYTNTALEHLKALELPAEYHQQFLEIIDKATHRSS